MHALSQKCLIRLAVAGALVAVVAAVYYPVHAYEFVAFDDLDYVLNNALVRAGLTWGGFLSAFTEFQVQNWHPLTWLSHMADVQMFGVSPGPHHVVNVLFHATNTVLLFLLFLDLTGATWKSALVAVLFGVHPLHVESVAWIAERKDLLSTLFLIVATFGYVRYAREPSKLRYALVMGAFALGLLAKPMLVTLPLVFLLLDYWPLGRWDQHAPGRMAGALLKEKVPLLAVAIASGIATFIAQHRGGAVHSTTSVPLIARIGNAVRAYFAYLLDTVWPRDLAVFYMHPALRPDGLSVWQVVASACAIAGITAGAIWARRTRPYIFVGWFWYLITLVPVIGIVQVGDQAMADRYTYVPLVGIFVAIAWTLGDIWSPSRARAIGISVACGAAIIVLGTLARHQVETWRNNLTLWERAASVTESNATAWKNLGTAYFDARRWEESLLAYREALRLDPRDAASWANIAIAYTSVGDPVRADECFSNAVRMAPGDSTLWFNIGVAAAIGGNWGRVAEAQARLARINPAVAAELDRYLASRQPR